MKNRSKYHPFKSHKVTLSLSEDHRYKLAILAAQLGVSCSEVVNRLLNRTEVENWEDIRSTLLEQLLSGEPLAHLLEELK